MNRQQNISPRIRRQLQKTQLLEFVGVLYRLDSFLRPSKTGFMANMFQHFMMRAFPWAGSQSEKQISALLLVDVRCTHTHGAIMPRVSLFHSGCWHNSYFPGEYYLNFWQPLGIGGSKGRNYGLKFSTRVQYTFCAPNMCRSNDQFWKTARWSEKINHWRNKVSNWFFVATVLQYGLCIYTMIWKPSGIVVFKLSDCQAALCIECQYLRRNGAKNGFKFQPNLCKHSLIAALNSHLVFMFFNDQKIQKEDLRRNLGLG